MTPCPCGEDHSDSPAWGVTKALIDENGETIEVTITAGSWQVPRIWIAFHGMKAWELEGLADKYGWKKRI